MTSTSRLFVRRGAPGDRVDLDAIIERTDIDAVVERVDVNAISERIRIGGVIARKTGHVADSALDLAQRQGSSLNTRLRATFEQGLDWPPTDIPGDVE